MHVEGEGEGDPISTPSMSPETHDPAIATPFSPTGPVVA